MTALLAAFADALRDPAQPVPDGLRAPPGGAPLAERLAVHRNTVLVSLCEVLGETYPVLAELLGRECFAAVARAHVLAALPRSPVMAVYGAELPAWIDSFEPMAGLPWLGDVARLEFARLRAASAADAPPLPATELATLLATLADGDALATARLQLHPSLQRLRLRHAAVSVWQAHQLDAEARDERLAALDLDEPESALVLRDPDDAVLVLPLSPAAFDLADALAEGCPLGPAAARHGADELTPLLALLLRHGAVTALVVDDGASPPQHRP